MMVGRMYEEVTLEDGSTPETLWKYFQARYPQLASDEMRRIGGMSVNGAYLQQTEWGNVVLRDDDEVDVLSQMAGG